MANFIDSNVSQGSLFTTNNCTRIRRIRKTDVSYLVQAGLPIFFNIALLAFIASRRKLINKKANKIFVNLQVVHVLLCVSGIIGKFDKAVEVVVFSNGCLIELFLVLILMTVDRYINIKYPFYYENLPTRKIIFMIVTSWAITVLSVTMYLYFGADGYHRVVISTFLLGIATFTLALSNIRIYIIAQSHVKAIKKYSTDNNNAARRNRITTLKSTYVCFSIIFSFVITWLPLFIHNAMFLLKIYRPAPSKTFTQIVVRLAMVNSLLDPLLYFCFNKDLKHELKLILTKRNHQHRLRKKASYGKHQLLFLSPLRGTKNT